MQPQIDDTLLQQSALDNLWLGKPVICQWNHGRIKRGTVLVIYARSRQAWVKDSEGPGGWHQPIEDLQLLPAEEPPPQRRWLDWPWRK